MFALCLSVNLLNWTLVWLAPGGTQNSEFSELSLYLCLKTFGQMVIGDTFRPFLCVFASVCDSIKLSAQERVFTTCYALLFLSNY